LERRCEGARLEVVANLIALADEAVPNDRGRVQPQQLLRFDDLNAAVLGISNCHYHLA
jgi:hypothetical protein